MEMDVNSDDWQCNRNGRGNSVLLSNRKCLIKERRFVWGNSQRPSGQRGVELHQMLNEHATCFEKETF